MIAQPIFLWKVLQRKLRNSASLRIQFYRERDITMTEYFRVDRNTKGAEPHHPKTVQEHYREIYFEILDVAINSIKDRFEQPSFKVFQAFENLLLEAINQTANDNMMHESILDIYKDEVDLDLVRVEANVLRTVLGDEKVVCFKDIHRAVKECSVATRDLMPNIVHVVKLLLINPVTSCTPERSFSTARRLKTWLRSTMKSRRFNSLSLLHVHKDLTDKLDLNEAGNEFVEARENRYNIFGKF